MNGVSALIRRNRLRDLENEFMGMRRERMRGKDN